MIYTINSRLGAWGAPRELGALLRSKASVDRAVEAALTEECPERLQACLRDYSKLIERASAMGLGDIWCKVKLAELNTNYELGSSFADVQALNRCIDGVSSIIAVVRGKLDRGQVAALLRTRGHALAELGFLTGRKDEFKRAIASYEASLEGLELSEKSVVVQLTQQNIELCRAQVVPVR